MHVVAGGGRRWQEVHIFRSVPLRDLFSLRAPSGPLMGTLSGTHVGTLSGTHFSKNKIYLIYTYRIRGIEHSL